MSKIVLLILGITIPFASGQAGLPPDSVNTILKTINSCTKDNYQKNILKFDKMITEYFSRKTTDELLKIDNKINITSESLRTFAPYLLREGTMAGSAKDCWANYKELIDSLNTPDETVHKDKLIKWNICIKASYHKKLKTVQAVTDCIESAKLK